MILGKAALSHGEINKVVEISLEVVLENGTVHVNILINYKLC